MPPCPAITSLCSGATRCRTGLTAVSKNRRNSDKIPETFECRYAHFPYICSRNQKLTSRLRTRNIRNAIALFMLALFVSYKAGITMFTHAHFINGVMIVHSHPFSSDSNHKHSDGQLLVLAQMQTTQYSMPEMPEAPQCPYRTIETQVPVKATPHITDAVTLWHSLRSPPHNTWL